MKRFFWPAIAVLLILAAIPGWVLLLTKPEEKPQLQIPTPPAQTAPAETLLPETQPDTIPDTIPETQPETQPETLPQETGIPETQPEEKRNFFYVPQYYQTDYPYVHFGSSTVASSGCSITCLAMVATYLTDQEYMPDHLAFHFADHGKNNIERLEYGLEQMQLPYVRAENVEEVLNAVGHGKVAIIMVDDKSIFTGEQHFIVVSGMSQDGNYIVNDPLSENYQHSEPYVKNCYDNGFPDYYLRQGFCGGWIFDKADMTEDSFRYDASLPDQREHRYTGYILNGEDIYTLACFVWAEARNESPEVQQAVAEVVLNRIVTEGYPNTVSGILRYTELKRASGAMAKVEEPDQQQYLAVDAAMYGPYVLPEDICFYSAMVSGTDKWGELGEFTFYRSK